MRKAFHKLRVGTQWCSALLLAVVALRFAWVSASSTFAGTGGLDRLDADRIADTLRAADLVDQAKHAVHDVVGQPDHHDDPPPSPEKPVRLMLLVKHSHNGSKVLVNGAFLGYTTYASDFSCMRGEVLNFQIVPERGRTIERSYECKGQTLVVSE